MFTFSNKYLRLASILVIIYAGYSSYRNNTNFGMNGDATKGSAKSESLYSISIDRAKNPSQYNLFEKCLYYFFHDEIDKERKIHLETIAAEKADAAAKTNARLKSSDSSNSPDLIVSQSENDKIISLSTSAVKNNSVISLTIGLPSGIVMRELKMQAKNQDWIEALSQSLNDSDIVVLKKSLIGTKIAEYKSVKLSISDQSIDFMVSSIDSSNQK